MDAKWKVRSVILGAALGVAVLGAPAAAGEGIRVVEVPEGPCSTVRVINDGVTVWEMVAEPFTMPDIGDVCFEALGLPLLPHPGGVYFLILAPGYEGPTTWYHTDGTHEGTVRMADYRGEILYGDRLYRLERTRPGITLTSIGPTDVRVVRRFRAEYAGILAVRRGLLRFKTWSGAWEGKRKSVKHWSSDGTRKGTHVVKR